jgi:hypothetical protein
MVIKQNRDVTVCIVACLCLRTENVSLELLKC